MTSSKFLSTTAAAASSAAKRGAAVGGTRPWKRPPLSFDDDDKAVPSTTTTTTTKTTKTTTMDAKHDLPMGAWRPADVRAAASRSVMLTWTPGSARDGLPLVSHGTGVYLHDNNHKTYLDWTSQAVCANLGHDVPAPVLEAVVDQLQTLPFVYGGLAMTEIRARLSDLLATHVLPGDLQGMVFAGSGAEANEAAYAMARRYTGREKILSSYRSYHGGTANALQATGDARRWQGRRTEAGSGNFVKMPHPYPVLYDLHGATPEERTETALAMLHEQIWNEGPGTIAAISLESIVGSGGVLIPPDGYLQGVRALCDEYGILLHCDEVMVGFGRTGQWFGFQHFDGVLPDLVTCAKGITSSILPLSMTACRAPIMEFFESQSIGWGSTYQAHPVALRCAYEQIKWLLRHDVVGRVRDLAPVFAREMRRVAARHACVKQHRAVGLFGCLDTHNPDGTMPRPEFSAATNRAFAEYRRASLAAGLIGMIRPPMLHVAPPLVITETELLDGFARQDEALETLDRALGF